MPKCQICGVPLQTDQSVCPDCGASTAEPTASFRPVGAPAAELGSVSQECCNSPVLVVRKGAQPGERFYLESSRLKVGREPDSDIFLNDVTVSRVHAWLDVADGDVTVTDAGSLNGTYVNDVCVDSALLHSGDILQIGTFQMVFFSRSETQS